MQQPKFVELESRQLIGFCLEMSRVNDRTRQLWQSFMPRRGEVQHRTGEGFMSMQVYPDGASQVADPDATFAKWAVVQVQKYESVPAGMETYDLKGGLYAVFVHNGPATDLSTIFYIFQDWLPNSEYSLDDREHFEALPEGYKALDPNAREEIWIPIRAKN